MPDDARISTALPTHPKTVKLQRRVGVQGCWSLICFILWVSNNRPTGELSGMSTEDIEIAAQWPGNPGDFVSALVEVRFLDGSDDSYRVHDWEEHNPWAANRPQRIVAAREAAKARWANAKGMRGACDQHETAMPHSPLPSPTHHTTEKQKGNSATAPTRRFIPPTLEEVTAYCEERDNNIDPKQFLNHYMANGWKQRGGNKIVDWKATVRTWEGNGVNSNGQQNKAEQRLERNLAAVRAN